MKILIRTLINLQNYMGNRKIDIFNRKILISSYLFEYREKINILRGNSSLEDILRVMRKYN